MGELVNTAGGGLFRGYYKDAGATDQRLRHGMYWSGDLAYRDADGWIYFAGRTADWMRVDGENLAAAPIERILMRLPAINRVAVYRCPTSPSATRSWPPSCCATMPTLTPAEFEEFLAAQPDLSPKAWPRYVWIAEICRRPRPTRSSSESWSRTERRRPVGALEAGRHQLPTARRACRQRWSGRGIASPVRAFRLLAVDLA